MKDLEGYTETTERTYDGQYCKDLSDSHIKIEVV